MNTLSISLRYSIIYFIFVCLQDFENEIKMTANTLQIALNIARYRTESLSNLDKITNINNQVINQKVLGVKKILRKNKPNNNKGRIQKQMSLNDKNNNNNEDQSTPNDNLIFDGQIVEKIIQANLVSNSNESQESSREKEFEKLKKISPKENTPEKIDFPMKTSLIKLFCMKDNPNVEIINEPNINICNNNTVNGEYLIQIKTDAFKGFIKLISKLLDNLEANNNNESISFDNKSSLNELVITGEPQFDRNFEQLLSSLLVKSDSNSKDKYSNQHSDDNNAPLPLESREPRKLRLMSNLLLNQKRKRNQSIINCPHFSEKHYAKGMCSNCYHKSGRVTKPWMCDHLEKFHYARGYCQNCYQMKFVTRRLNSSNDKRLSMKESIYNELNLNEGELENDDNGSKINDSD